jgi:predicted Rdx family selenoprotein
MLDISITYLRGEDFANDAINLEIDLLNQFEPHIERISLVPDLEKKFIVTVDGEQIYSLQEKSNSYNPQEIIGMIQYLIHRGHL